MWICAFLVKLIQNSEFLKLGKQIDLGGQIYRKIVFWNSSSFAYGNINSCLMVQKYASMNGLMVPSYLPYSSCPNWAAMLRKSHLEEYIVGILPAILIFPHIRERSPWQVF